MTTSAGRTEYAAKNTVFGLIGKVTSLLANFISRSIFIYILGKYYLGVNGLYTEILSFLSFAELGFGSAMTFALYKPVADNNEEKICELMVFYKHVYRIVALVIFALGLLLIPFLEFIIQDADALSLFELRLYFFIFLINNVTTYFVIYKYSYLNAAQMTYITTNIETAVSLICVFGQVVALIVTRSFLVYLLAHTVILVLSRVGIALYLNKRYPILNRKPSQALPQSDKRSIVHEVKGLAVHQFSSVAVHATDSIIISAVPALGIAIVGAVSNYNMIINAVAGIVIVLFNSIVAGFGNLVATSDEDHFKKVFDEANFINFWIYGVCAVCFIVLLTPFIQLWVGSEYVIDQVSVALIVVNFYLQGQSTVFNNARIAKGNFNLDKWWSLAQAIVNLVVSIVGAIYLGLVGVFIGTVLSRLVFIISRPCCTYRFLFGVSPTHYFKSLLRYFALTTLATLSCYAACYAPLQELTWFTFAFSVLCCFLVSNSIFFLFSRNAREAKAFINRLSMILEAKRRHFS